MAFDFLGAFEREEFDKLTNFVNAELLNIDKRKSAIAMERERLDSLKQKYVLAEERLLDQTLQEAEETKDGVSLRDPTIAEIYKVDPDSPRGDEAQDLQRKQDINPGNLTPAERQAFLELDQSNLSERTVPLIVVDAPTSLVVEKIKSFIRPAIRMKRDNIQFAIMKLRDQQEFLNKELRAIITREEDLTSLIDQVNSMILDDDLPAAKESPEDPDLSGVIG